MPLIIATVSAADDRAAVLRAADGCAAPLFCESIDHALSAAASADVRAVVWEARPDAARRLAVAVRAVSRLPASVPQILRAELGRESCALLCDVARDLPASVRISLHRFDDLARDVAVLVSGHAEYPADFALVDALAPLVPRPQQEIVVAAALLAKRRVNVPDLARATRRSIRSVECQLKAAPLMPPAELLGWCVSLHAVWRAGTLGWPLKRAAGEAGFRSTQALSNYVHRHTGRRPTALLAAGGFAALLAQVAAMIGA